MNPFLSRSIDCKINSTLEMAITYRVFLENLESFYLHSPYATSAYDVDEIVVLEHEHPHKQYVHDVLLIQSEINYRFNLSFLMYQVLIYTRENFTQ